MVRKLLLIAVAAAAVSGMLPGCGEESPPPAPAPAPKKVVAKPEPQPAGADVEVVQEPPAPVYAYDPSGRRDPFTPLLEVKRPMAVSDEPLTPLQRFDLSQLRLIGVIIGKGEPRAMVVAPDGKSFILKKGIKVGKNDGTVAAITKDGVEVEERYYDFSGEVRRSIQAIQLPQREGVE
ncbi:type IV pilus assembly protein PilP [Desulfuromonas versatilis]|uniref:Type IV pilus assembly protein PilP n=1 Tax=Desulfuromonas versatilis TaxID=2802975 RepID=A0ABN6DX30_9BACT|nr:pilus assembly protein PilP [Desulfuromonas versatilis]BCR04682.1 type IV pilus assembly protein PilP [Desulfuromonas versatilis]